MATTIPVTETEVFSSLPLDLLLESPFNARKLYNQTQLEELSVSIKANGIVQPILVRPLTGNHCEVIAGSRRRRAAILAGLTEVPVIIRTMSDEQAREISLIENIQREDVHPMHEALGMQDALTVGGYDVGRLASRLGKHERHIYKRLQLCRLIDQMQQSYLDGWWSLAAITAVSKLTQEQQTAAYAHFFKEGDKPQREYVINEREIDGWIRYNVLVVLDKAVFDVNDAELVPAAGSCTDCSKRTSASPMLWENIEEDQCTDPPCFQSKVKAFMDAKRERLTKKHGPEGFVQISNYSRRTTDPNSKILGAESYTEAPKGSCEFSKPGLMVEGDLGKVKWVCTNKQCPTHGRLTTSTDPDRVRAKEAEKESAVRGRIFQAILAKYPKQTTREMREFIAVKFANRLTHDVDITFAKLLKVDTGKGQGINYPGYVRSLNDRQLEVFMLAVALVPEAKVFSYSSHERKGPLFDLAKEFDVPVKEITTYCDSLFHAKTKRGNDRKLAMSELPTDPVEKITSAPVEVPKPASKASKKKTTRKSA